MKAKQHNLEQMEAENSSALNRIADLYLALNDLEAFERALLAGGKNCPATQTLRRPSPPVVLHRSHAN